MKRMLLVFTCALCVIVLTGCSVFSSSSITSEAVPTLGPAVVKYQAPEGDEGLGREQTVALYLPSRDGHRLLAQYLTINTRRGEFPEEAVVRALLAFPMNEEVQPLGRGITVLGLYGQNPVEVTNGVCTVNLSSSVLQLDYSEQYAVCLALASSLSSLGTVDYVNVLVADQPMSLDITGNLPAGSIAAHPGEELSVLWEQMDARRTPLGQDAATQMLSAAATLFFPLADERGFLSETRRLSFSGQRADVLTNGLLSALSNGAQYLEGSAVMPEIGPLLAKQPEVEELPDGGRRIHLYFVDNLITRLELLGLEPSSFLGSVAYTIITFVPGVAGVYLYSDGKPLDKLGDGITLENGLVRRNQLTGMLKVQQEIFLPKEDGLSAVVCTVPWRAAADPMTSLLLLMDSSSVTGRNDLQTALPTGMDETDILGMAIQGDLLLLNLSPRFERLLRQADKENEQLMCYSMVNTLCRQLGTRRISFFFEGETRDNLGGSIYWGGEFQQNNGLQRK